MDLPRISIVTPVYNQVDYIEETIKSVIDQGYPNLEYIIIDGGSTDGTVDVIKKYDSELYYWVSESDNGMYDALQKGFDHSTGDIMGWINADDVFFNGCLFQISNIFSNHEEVNWLTGSNTHIDEQGRFLLNIPCRKICKYQFLSGDYMWIAQESTLWRRSLWEAAGAYISTELHAAGDFELWLRFIQNDKLYYVNNCIGMFRHRKGQISGQLDNYIAEVNSIYKKLEICDFDKKILEKYKRKKKIAALINKTKIFNGNKIVKLRSFENKYMSVPSTLEWLDEIKGYKYVDEC